MEFALVVPFVVLLFVVLITIPSAANDTRKEARRRQTMADLWAEAHGATYQRTNPAILTRLDRPPVDIRGRPLVTEFIQGTTPGGHNFWSFQHSVIVGEKSDAIKTAFAMVRLDAKLPRLYVTVQAPGINAAGVLRGQDIELESEDFNQKFRVTSDNGALAYGVLHPLVMQWLMGPGEGLVPFMIDQDDLICWRPGAPDYSTLDKLLNDMDTFISHIPQGVYEQFGLPPADASLGY